MNLFFWKTTIPTLVMYGVLTGSSVLAIRALAKEPTPDGPASTQEVSPSQPSRDAVQQFLKRAEKFRPTKAELLWQQIPWVAVLKEGRLDEAASINRALEQARKEHRPLLIWSVDGNPYDQC